MISRRSFLSLLCSIPFVGRFARKPEPIYDGEIRQMGSEGNIAVDRKAGISIRFVKKYDIVPDPNPARWDGHMCEDGVIRWTQS